MNDKPVSVELIIPICDCAHPTKNGRQDIYSIPSKFGDSHLKAAFSNFTSTRSRQCCNHLDKPRVGLIVFITELALCMEHGSVFTREYTFWTSIPIFKTNVFDGGVTLLEYWSIRTFLSLSSCLSVSTERNAFLFCAINSGIVLGRPIQP